MGIYFLSADGKEMLLAVGSDRQFRELCKILSIPEIADNEKFMINIHRVANRTALNEILKARIMTFHAEDLSQCLKESNVPAAIVQNLEEALRVQEAKSLLLESSDGMKGLRTYVGDAENIQKSTHILPPPHFGENTEEVLLKILHYEPETIENMRSSGITN